MMRPVNHTRAGSAVPLWLALTLAAGACGSNPIYEFEPTDLPLHYTLKSEGGNEIDTPAGVQSASFSSEASLTVAFEKETEAGTPFTITIDSIVLKTGGDFGGGMTDLSDQLAGKPFRGTMAWDGSITFTEVPELKADNLSGADMQRVASAVLVPLPPGGDLEVAEWEHNVTLPMGSGLEGESVYSGLMSIAGDTVLNGTKATILVSEGVVEMEGSGQPEGAPAEVDMLNQVEARTVYFWDPQRGVLLAAKGTGQGGGTLSTMGFSMPMSTHSTVDIQLVTADSGGAAEAAEATDSSEGEGTVDPSASTGSGQSP